MAQKQYQVLARKWRPQQFDEIIGQDHVTTTLKHAIEQNRLAHAYLFVGPRGTGKTSLARILAKALNCAKGPTVTPCDQCDNCREITDGRSMDVLEIDGASNNGVEQVRELRETCRYTPAHGRFKIYIIDEVHMLSNAAFNALLKTLEEPPAHVKFFFATTEPQKMLSTILSRCQRFDLRRIPANLIVAHLKKIAGKEKIATDDKALSAIARGAEGGMRDAESTLDQLIAFCGNQITEPDVLSVFGLAAHDQLAALTDALIDGEPNQALRLVRDLDESGKDLQRLLADLLNHFRNLLLVTLDAGAIPAVDLPDTERDLLKTQAARADSDTVLRIIDALAAAEGRLRYALSKRIFLEIAIVKAIRARNLVGIDEVLLKLNELKNRLAAGAEPEADPSPPPAPPARSTAPAKKPVSTEKPAAATSHAAATPSAGLEEAWADAVEHLAKVAPLAKTYLVGSRPSGMRGSVVVVAFDPEFAERREFVDTGRNRELLQNRLKAKLGRDVTVSFEIDEAGAAKPAQPPAPAAPGPARRAEPPKAVPAGPAGSVESFTNDPLIKKALEIFKGTIVDVRE